MRDESAVSAVVGAVLLLALFSTAMTIWTVGTLPQWKADKEQNHQAVVGAELGSLKADLEALAARRDAGPVTATIPLQVAKVPLLQSTPARGAIGASATGFNAAFAFPSGPPSVFFSDGVAVGTPSQAIGASASPCSGKCIQVLGALEIGVITTNVNDDGDTASVTVTIIDSAPTPVTLVAQLVHADLATSAGCPTEVRFVVATTTRIVAPCAGTSLGSTSAFRVNLLNDDYPLASAISRLTAPVQVTLSTSTNNVGGGAAVALTATYAATFQEPSGLLRLVGSGVSDPAPVGAVTGGRVVYTPAYQAFPSQELVLEGGAVLVDAGGTSQAMLSDPAFSMEVSGGRGSLQWTLVQLTGNSATSGAKDASVQIHFQGLQDVVLQTSSMTVTLTTQTAAGWTNYMSLAALTAGAQSSAQVVHNPAAGTATLTLSSQPWVVHLRIIQAEVVIR